MPTALSPQKHYVYIGSQPHVVSQVPAVVVGILVDDDVVAIPPPVVAEADVIRRNAEVETAKPKAIRAASLQVPGMPATEAAPKAAMLPGVIKVIVAIIVAGVVTDPLAIGMNMGRVRMSLVVVEVTPFFGWMWRAHPLRTMGRWASMAVITAAFFVVLGKRYVGTQATNRQHSAYFFHVRFA